MTILTIITYVYVDAKEKGIQSQIKKRTIFRQSNENSKEYGNILIDLESVKKNPNPGGQFGSLSLSRYIFISESIAY